MPDAPRSETRPAPNFGGFGTYRFILACIVAFSHFMSQRYQHIGVYALYGFFILSGYVVSHILKYSYLPMRRGQLKYAVNRFLRVYPSYWAALAMITLLIYYFPAQASESDMLVQLPATLRGWVVNITTFGTVDMVGAFFVPILLVVAWALSVEVWFWSMMPVFLTNPRARFGFTAFAIFYTLLVVGLSIYPGPPKYFAPLRHPSPLAIALPFCIGMWMLLKKSPGNRSLPRWYYPLATLAFVAIFTVAPLYLDHDFTMFYIAMAVNTAVVYGLSKLNAARMTAGFMRLDRRLGDLSYPIMLLHLPVLIAVHVAFPALPLNSWAICAAALAATIPVTILFRIAVDEPVNRLRHKIKC